MYKKYLILEVNENQMKAGFNVGQIVEGKLLEDVECADIKNYRSDIIRIKNSDYFFVPRQVKEVE